MNDTHPVPCESPKMNLATKRFIVMQRVHDRDVPQSIHENLDGAMTDLSRLAAQCLIEYYDTARSALYLVAVDR